MDNRAQQETNQLSDNYKYESPLKVIGSNYSISDRKNNIDGFKAATQYGIAPTELNHTVVTGESLDVGNDGKISFSGIAGRSYDPEKLLMGLVTHKKDGVNAVVHYPHVDANGKVVKVTKITMPDAKREAVERVVFTAIDRKYKSEPRKGYNKGDNQDSQPTGQDAANLLGIYKRTGKIIELLGKSDDVFMMDESISSH